MKKIYIVLPLILIGVLYIVTHFSDMDYYIKDSFKDMILDEYKEDNFNYMSIHKYTEDEETYVKTDNGDYINEIINIFKDLEIKKIDYKKVPKGLKINTLTTRFKNNNTYEELSIDILNEEYIYVNVRTMEKKVDKEKNLTVWKEDRGNYGHYKIYNGKININAIEEMIGLLEDKEL